MTYTITGDSWRSYVGTEHNFSVDVVREAGLSQALGKPFDALRAGKAGGVIEEAGPPRQPLGKQSIEGNSYRSSTLNVAKR